MALEQLGGPVLPGRHQRNELLHLIGLLRTAQEVARARRRARPLVQHRDRRLASRESLIEDGQARDDDREEAEPKAGLDTRTEPRQASLRSEGAGPELSDAP